jgi:hypothetical protein
VCDEQRAVTLVRGFSPFARWCRAPIAPSLQPRDSSRLHRAAAKSVRRDDVHNGGCTTPGRSRPTRDLRTIPGVAHQPAGSGRHLDQANTQCSTGLVEKEFAPGTLPVRSRVGMMAPAGAAPPTSCGILIADGMSITPGYPDQSQIKLNHNDGIRDTSASTRRHDFSEVLTSSGGAGLTTRSVRTIAAASSPRSSSLRSELRSLTASLMTQETGSVPGG